MLILTRKVGQAVIIDAVEGLDPQTPIGDLFAQGSIEVRVTNINGGHVRLGIQADKRFRIRRDELLQGTNEPAA